jgi:hypothetical protein
MKVRICGNKIRLRLKQPEVEKFEQTGVVTEALQFGPRDEDQVKFTLRLADRNTIDINFYQNETTVLVPTAMAGEWATTELVGFDADADTGKGKIISILVEKDFVCMDGREEDNTGSYPNPLATADT